MDFGSPEALEMAKAARTAKAAERKAARERSDEASARLAENPAIAKRLERVPERFRDLLRRVLTGQGTEAERVKAKCLDCVCWQRREVTLCTAIGCASWPTRPYQRGAVAIIEAEAARFEADGFSESAEVMREHARHVAEFAKVLGDPHGVLRPEGEAA